MAAVKIYSSRLGLIAITNVPLNMKFGTEIYHINV
jgi:hypothetical protein